MTIRNSKILFKLMLLLVFVINAGVLFAQFPKTWYFGQQAGVDFSSGSSVNVLLSNSISTPEGCATWANSQGGVTFFSNGTTKYSVKLKSKARL